MRIDCKHVWDHISAYIDGEVDADLRAEIDRHLETCEICSAVLDSTRNVVVLMADDRVFELPAGFSQRLHARLDKELELVQPLNPRRIAPSRPHERWAAAQCDAPSDASSLQPHQHQRQDRQRNLQAALSVAPFS